MMISIRRFSWLIVVLCIMPFTAYGQNQDKKPTSDLFKAILDGQNQTALALINQGVDVNAKDITAGSVPGSTPLMYAAWKGDTAVVNALLQKGAEVNAQNKYGLTALLRATNKGHAYGEDKYPKYSYSPSRKSWSCDQTAPVRKAEFLWCWC